jgi:predicted outer membrane repeat protein
MCGRFRPVLLELEDRRLPSTFTVTSTADDGSSGTLRWAALLADSAGGSNTIAFDPTFFGTPRSITLVAGEVPLTSGTITINGPGAGLLTVNGNDFDRIFQVNAGVTASMTGLTLTGGSTIVGGALYVTGNATLSNCTISGNSATDGGGLYCSGRLTLTGCTISGNSAKYGGALWTRGTATVTGCTISGNSSYMGGGVLNDMGGHANLTNCTISGNSASLGGGLSNYGQANLTACTVSGNTATNTPRNAADNPGGGIYNYSIS